MQEIERAIQVTGALAAALADELAKARAQRAYIGRLDGDALLARAQARVEWTARLAGLEQDLAAALAEVAPALGLGEVTLDAIEARAPGPGRRLRAKLAEVRLLAAQLREVDALNHELAARALACVRGYLTAVSGRAAAYDRRGAAAPVPLRTASRTV